MRYPVSSDADLAWLLSHDWSPVGPGTAGTVMCLSGGDFVQLPVTDVCSRCGAVKSGDRLPVPFRTSAPGSLEVGRDPCETMAVRQVMES